MTTNLKLGNRFPDFALPNHDNQRVQLSDFTQPNLTDKYLGFTDGYPLILVFDALPVWVQILSSAWKMCCSWMNNPTMLSTL